MKTGPSIFRATFKSLLGRYQNLNLQNKITLALVAGALFIGGAVALPAFLLNRFQLLESTHALITAKAELEGQRIQLLITSDLAVAESLAANTVTANALADSVGRDNYLAPLLQNQKLQVPQARLLLADYAGRSVASSMPPDTTPLPNKVVFDTMERSARAQSYVMRDAPGLGTTLVVILPVVYRLTGNVEGGIVLYLPLETLLPKNAGYDVSSLVDGEGRLLAGGVPGGPQLQARAALHLPAPMQALGLEHYLARDRNAALHQLDVMAAVFGLLGVLLVVVVVVVARRAGIWLATPLHELATASEEIAATGRPQMLPIRSGGDEFARVSMAFNMMVSSLRELHAELERRVEERTQALVSSESQLKYVMDATGEGLWDWDLRAEKASHNAQWCKLLGLDTSYLTHSFEMFSALLHPEDRESALAAIQAALDGDVPYNHEHRMLHSDGRFIWVLDRGKIVEHDQDGCPVRMVGSVMDITDRKSASEQIRVRELYLRATLDNLPFLFWLKDAESRFLAVNSEFAKACGRASSDEVVGLTDLDVWPADLAEGYRADDREVIESGHEKAVEEPVETQGRRSWIETYKKPVISDDGTVLGTVGFARDITDRRMAEETLRERTEQLDAIFSLSPDGFISFDAGRRIKYVNPAFKQMTGFSDAELVGQDEAAFSQLLAAHCNQALSFPGLDHLRSKLELKPTRKPLRSLVELDMPIRRVLDIGLRASQSETVSQILYFRDVTYETEVDQMKSDFLSTAAHELRTPMASILGFSELLLSKDFDAAIRNDLLETIHKQSELMASILNELLDLARIEARRGKDFVLESLSLGDLLQEAAMRFSAPAGRAPPLMLSLETSARIRADRKKMLQVINNVLSNAYKYSPQGGDVVIRQLPSETRDGQTLIGFRIEDAGIGMTPAQLARVCERFYRADASGKIPGTGLGMSIVKEIVELHQGAVNISSEAGKGTRVEMWLPIALHT